MESLLCDEVLQEILQRLPPSSSIAVPLVCKRWLAVHRNCRFSLFLRFPSANPSSLPAFSSFLSRYPRVSSLTVILVPPSDKGFELVPFDVVPDYDDEEETDSINSSFLSDQILLSVASNCPNLRHFGYLAGSVSPPSLISFSSSCKHISSLNLTSIFPFSLRWLTSFPALKDLSLVDCRSVDDSNDDESESASELELPLESLCLSGIRAGDRGLGWLWRRCTKLRRLQLRSCEGTGDGASFSSFVRCLPGLQELELRTCRTIADGILLRLAQFGVSLNSLLLYDGGSRDGLHYFISHCRCSLQKLDLRLPLDLDDDHLSAVAENLRGLVSVRLQSCCFITGEGLKTLALNAGLEELALINCDVIEREPGLLTSLGQSLRELRKLDLSYNKMLPSKELVSVLVNCKNLVDVKLKGCKRLTGIALLSVIKSCNLLETIDIKQCCGIESDTIEFFLLNSPRIKQVHVEESKLSAVAKAWASQKFIQIVG